MMRACRLAAWAVVLTAGTAAAQRPVVFTAFDAADPPADLPLIPVPGPPVPAAPFAPGGPPPGYEHGYLYLPEPGPEFDRRPEPFRELWRVSVGAELAWLSTTGLPRTLELNAPEVFSRRVFGPVVATDGRGADAFQGGVSVTAARRLGDRGGIDFGLTALPGSPRRLDGFVPGTVVAFADPDTPVLLRAPRGYDRFGTWFPATVSTAFVGLDVNYRHAVLRTETARVDVLAGYRFAHLSDQLYLGDEPDGDRADSRLEAVSNFHGGQFGVAVGLDRGTWYTDGVVKIAYGAVSTDTTARGAFDFTRPRPRLGGETRAAVLPTVGWKVGYRRSDHASVYAAYSFQYLDRVARLGDAFCQCGGHSDLWINSLGLGAEWRF